MLQNTESFSGASKDVNPEANAENNIQHMFASHKQNVGQNHNTKVGNKSFGNVLKFTYLGNFCYHSFPNLLVFPCAT
jgi:hypothetical protein